MRLFELFEARPERKEAGPSTRNYVAKYAQTSGKGRHSPSDAEKIKRGDFRKIKHKDRDIDEERDDSDFL